MSTLKTSFCAEQKKTLLIWSISNFYEPIEKCHQIDSGNITIKATLTVNNNFVLAFVAVNRLLASSLLALPAAVRPKQPEAVYRLGRLEQCLKMKATVERYACNSLEKWNTL